jgi:hypothetical protein
MAGVVFTQRGVTKTGDHYWAIDVPTIGEMGWRYIVVLTADAISVCRVETRNGFYDRLRQLTEGAAYAEVFKNWSRWFPTATLEVVPLNAVRRLELVELTHQLTIIAHPTEGRQKRVSIITPSDPLASDLFGELHQRLDKRAEVRSEVASVGQLARSPSVALAGAVLLTVLLISGWLATESGAAAGGRHSGILAAVSWLVSQIGPAGIIGLCGAALLAPLAWLLVRVSHRPLKRVISLTAKPDEPSSAPDPPT